MESSSGQPPSGQLALIKAVRSLEQDKTSSRLPEHLTEIAGLLSSTPAGDGAVEKMLLRLLLKYMSEPSAEQIRRFPGVWSVLGALFPRIRPHSLAKALADWRFIGILQQTLKEASSSQNPAVATEEPPAKRTKREPSDFELGAQRGLGGCLRLAESLFQALNSLHEQCRRQFSAEEPLMRSGTAFLRSLFFMADSAQMQAVLIALFNICNLALGSTETYADQASWIATFTAVWDLHIQSDEKSVETVILFANLGVTMLGKLTGSWGKEPAWHDKGVRQQWAQDVRVFLTRRLILPSRASFLNTGSMHRTREAIILASVAAAPVFFDLSIKAPPVLGDLATKQTTTAWIQSVFDLMEETVRPFQGARRTKIMATLLGMAVEHDIRLSLDSLRLVCREYALQESSADWSILTRLVKLDPDVFLVSEAGKAMLEDILGHMGTSEVLDEDTWHKLAEFAVLLARGFVKSRDLSGFLKLWLANLSREDNRLSTDSPRNAWSQRRLVTAVAESLQDGMNISQIHSCVEWLGTQSGPAEKEGALLILEAIATGISERDMIDSNTELFNAAFSGNFPNKASRRAHAARWTVAQICFSWASEHECREIWPRVQEGLEEALQTNPICQEDTFAAFKCVVAAWIANYPNGQYENEAARLTCLFLDRLRHEDPDSGQESNASVSIGTYLSWIVQGTSRLLSLVQKRGLKFAEFILRSMLDAADSITLSEKEAIHAILENHGDAHNLDLGDILAGRAIEIIQGNSLSSPAVEAVVTLLLDTPTRAIRSAQRDEIGTSIIRQWRQVQELSRDCWSRNIALLLQFTEGPFSFERVAFTDLDALALSVPLEVLNDDLTGGGLVGVRDCLQLLEELARRVLRKNAAFSSKTEHIMASWSFINDEWEWQPESDYKTTFRVPLLKTLLAALTDSSPSLDLSGARKKLLGVATSYVAAFCAEWNEAHDGRRKNWSLLRLLIALDAVDVKVGGMACEMRPFVKDLEAISDDLLRQGINAGLEIRIFLARHFFADLESPLDLRHVATHMDSTTNVAEAKRDALGVTKDTIYEYVDTVLLHIEGNDRLRHVKKLLSFKAGEVSICQLLVNHRVLRTIKDTPHAENEGDGDKNGEQKHVEWDLATAHSMLLQRLPTMRRVDEFVLVAQTLHMLLEQKASSMVQGNIDFTLSQVAIACSAWRRDAQDATPASSSPKAFHWLCRLVEAVIKYHRRRIFGRFHIVTTVLQALLKCLIKHPVLWRAGQVESGSESATTPPQQYARLITLLCEPSEKAVASLRAKDVGGGGGGGASQSHSYNSNQQLESNRDWARRYAGKYMYTVLMEYAKLLVEEPVPRELREALEPGMTAVMDITSPGVIAFMREGMDPGGRAVLKELYRRYEKFGKWSGI